MSIYIAPQWCPECNNEGVLSDKKIEGVPECIKIYECKTCGNLFTEDY